MFVATSLAYCTDRFIGWGRDVHELKIRAELHVDEIVEHGTPAAPIVVITQFVYARPYATLTGFYSFNTRALSWDRKWKYLDAPSWDDSEAVGCLRK